MSKKARISRNGEIIRLKLDTAINLYDKHRIGITFDIMDRTFHLCSLVYNLTASRKERVDTGIWYRSRQYYEE